MTAPSSAASPAQEFFATIENTFERAARRTGITTRSLALAGAHVRLRFAGESLVLPITRSLAHLATSDVLPPDLTILLWDTAASGVPVPPPPWERDAYGRRGEIVGFSDAAIFSAYQHNAGSLLLYDARRRLALYAAVDGSALPTYETSVPLRSIFHWWAQSRGGLQMTHAAAVGRGDGCVLVIGESGAGKSSTALACLDSPLSFLSDDYCLVGTEGAPVVHCLYGTAKATAAGLAALPASLSAMVGNPHEAGREKLVLCLSEHVPHKLLASAPLRAILLPKLSNATHVAIERAFGAQALLTMGGTSFLQLPHAGAELVHGLARVIRSVPSFYLHLTPDRAQIAPAIDRLLDELRSRPGV